MLDIALRMLQPAINMGLLESDFWDMTVAEVERYLEGAVWRLKLKAQYDYSLADLFGASIGRLFDSNCEYPAIEKVYPNLFEEEEVPVEQEQDMNTTNSVNNFLAFAMAHNAKKRKEVDDINYDNRRIESQDIS